MKWLFQNRLEGIFRSRKDTHTRRFTAPILFSILLMDCSEALVSIEGSVPKDALKSSSFEAYLKFALENVPLSPTMQFEISFKGLPMYIRVILSFL